MNKSLISKFTLGLVLAGSSITHLNSELESPIKLLSLRTKSFNKLVSNRIIKPNKIEDLSEFESLDFTPNYEINNEVVEVNEFHEVKKNITLNSKKILANIDYEKINPEREVVIDKLDLSYAEYEDQGKVEYSKLPTLKIAKFELNTKRYNVNTQNIAKLDLPEIKEIKNEDRISTKVAATEESLTSSQLKLGTSDAKVLKDENPKANELVYFDYSNEGKVNINEKQEESSTEVVILDKKQAPGSLVFFDYSNNKKVEKENVKSSDVMTTIGNIKIDTALSKSNTPAKESKKSKRKTKKSTPKVIAMNTQNQVSFGEDKVNLGNAGIQKAVAKLFEEDKSDSCLEEKPKNEYSNVDAKISLISVDINKIDMGIHNFDMEMAYGNNIALHDYGTGVIDFHKRMNGKMNIIRSRFFTKGHFPTVTDLVYEDAEVEIQIPSLSNDYVDNILNKYKLRGLGAYLLVELDNKTEDVELDQLNKYEAKFFLDSRFKVVDRGNAEYQYILFVGAETGNTTLYFKKTDNKIVSKLINLVEREVYYEPNFYAGLEKDKFSLYEESVLSQCKSPLSLPAKTVLPWSFDAKLSKTTINGYSSPEIDFPLGTRKYYEVKARNLYFGRWSQDAVVIPDEQYIEHVYKQFDYVGDECMVQVNINKEIASFSYAAETGNDVLLGQEKFLDNDGHFYNNPSPNTKKIFLKGEGIGVFNMHIEYLDGSTQNLQSFCGKDSYLIEQL